MLHFAKPAQILWNAMHFFYTRVRGPPPTTTNDLHIIPIVNDAKFFMTVYAINKIIAYSFINMQICKPRLQQYANKYFIPF